MRWCLRVCDGSPTGAAGCGTGLNADSRGAGVKVNGVQGRIWSASLSARSASLRAARAVVEADALIGPLRRLSSTTGQRQRKEKQFHAITTPTRLVLPPRDGSWENRRRPKRARRRAKIGACTDTSTSVSAEGHCTGARPSGLFFWTVHGPFSFPQVGKENGGCIPAGQAPCGSRIPVAAGRRPKFPRAVCNLPYTLQGRPYHRAAEGGGPYGCTERIYPRASLRPSR